MSFETIFEPGLRHWREYQEYQKDRVLTLPALDKGPRPGPIQIDVDAGQVVIDPAALPASNDPDRPA